MVRVEPEEAGAPGQQIPITHQSSWSLDSSPWKLLLGAGGLACDGEGVPSLPQRLG